LYAAFALWITLSPWKTSAAMGYGTLGASGRSEYLVVYGGLQLGLAVFFALLAINLELHRLGLLFSVCLYVPIVLYRLITVGRFWPVESTTLIVGALEVVLLVAAVVLLVAYR
jgi:hypothetical protein